MPTQDSLRYFYNHDGESDIFQVDSLKPVSRFVNDWDYGVYDRRGLNIETMLKEAAPGTLRIYAFTISRYMHPLADFYEAFLSLPHDPVNVARFHIVEILMFYDRPPIRYEKCLIAASCEDPDTLIRFERAFLEHLESRRQVPRGEYRFNDRVVGFPIGRYQAPFTHPPERKYKGGFVGLDAFLADLRKEREEKEAAEKKAADEKPDNGKPAT